MATTITPTIVNLNTTVTRAPQPSQLQRSGAFVSLGGSSLATGTYQYAGQLSDVTGLLQPPANITSLAWAGGTVTATVGSLSSLEAGQTFLVTIAGASPAGYNGTYLATVESSTTFTYQLAANLGAATAPGTFTHPGAADLTAMGTTFFAQGQAVGAYVLELGAQDSGADAVAALSTWITENPSAFYAFLLPPSMDTTALVSLAANYASPNAQTYFFPTRVSLSTGAYGPNKSAIVTVRSPAALPGEFQAASVFYNWLTNNPSAASPAAPMAFRYVFGVTPWPQTGQSATINAALTAAENVILTGAEGGISTATLFKGTTADGQQAMFWYAVDWFKIQIKQAIAAAILNGSNSNPPLEFNQAGINTLLEVAQNIANSGIAFGLALSCTITATDFFTYVTENPDDYDAGTYNGFVMTVTPQLGFLSVTFNIDAVQFAA